MTPIEPHKEFGARADLIQGLVQGDNNTVTLVYQSGEQRTVPFLAPPLPLDHSIVGHEELLKQVKAGLMAGKSQVLVVLPGVGKTTLAVEVANAPDIIRHFSDGVLWASLGHQPECLSELKRWARALGMEEEELAALGSAAQARDAIADRIGARRMLVVIDDVWQESDARQFIIGANCAHLVTSRIPTEVLDFTEHLTSVGELSEDEGLSLLAQFAPKVAAEEEAEARALVRDYGGLPLAMVLLGKYLRRESRSSDPKRIRHALQVLRDERAGEKGELSDALGSAIELSYTNEALGDDGRAALRALSIFRPKPHEFSDHLAAEVAQVDVELLWKLDDAGLIERTRSSDDTSFYTMQRTIADHARARLAPEERQEKYRRAVEYFREQMKNIEEQFKSRGSYASWYRYESSQWQDAKDSWLYYLGHLGDTGSALLAFLRAYFDAFWWWGCYLDFDYCNQLIKEWRERETSPAGREVLRCVHAFQASYPKETEDRRAPTWPMVDTALTRLLQLAGLQREAAQLEDEEHRHIRALVDILLAEVQRFGYGERERAARLYAEAGRLFEMDGDGWDLAWLLYHFADMNVERGEMDTALDQLKRALDLGKSEQDPEVVAQACRAQGDIFLALGDAERAGKSYTLAAFHAFRFQADPEPPDPYTVRFYTQTCERIFSRLEARYRQQAGDAIAISAELHSFWRPYRQLHEMPEFVPDFARLWAQGRTAELRAHLFPAGFRQEEIAARGQQYGAEVRQACERLQPAVDAAEG